MTGNYLSAGADVTLGHRKKFEAYFGVNTIGDYDVPNEPVSNTDSSDTSSSSVDTFVDTGASNVAVNDDLQTEHFPEYSDCGC